MSSRCGWAIASEDPAARIDADTLRAKPDRPRCEIYLLAGRQAGGLDAVQALLADHLAYLRALRDQGHLILAGPTLVERGAGYRGDGCLLIRAAGLDEAERIAAADPYQAGGARTYEVTPWLASEGLLFEPLCALGSAAERRQR